MEKNSDLLRCVDREFGDKFTNQFVNIASVINPVHTTLIFITQKDRAEIQEVREKKREKKEKRKLLKTRHVVDRRNIKTRVGLSLSLSLHRYNKIQ